MAAAAAAALLDELMGRDRNLAPTEKKPELRWNDHQVMKLVKYTFFLSLKCKFKKSRLRCATIPRSKGPL